jgi:hypothetical protein
LRKTNNNIPAQSIGKQDIPIPQQIAMYQSKHQQPAHPAVMQQGGIKPLCHGIFSKNKYPCSEQHGENAHELLAGEDVAHDPDPPVQTIQIPIGSGIDIGCHGHGEALDVHDQDAQYCHSPENIQRNNSIMNLHACKLRNAPDLKHILSPGCGDKAVEKFHHPA